MPQFIYFPKNSPIYNGHYILFQTGNEDLLVTYEILSDCTGSFFIWSKMRGEYYPIAKYESNENNTYSTMGNIFRHHINGYRKYRSKYWEFIQDKKANCEDWETEQLAFKTWEFPDLETENVEARLPRDYEEPRNLIYATFEEPHVLYLFNPPQEDVVRNNDNNDNHSTNEKSDERIKMEYRIIKEIATIKDYGNKTLEFNYIQWGNNPVKYDFRWWEEGKPRKGVTLSRDDAEVLHRVLAEELGYNIEPDEDLLFDYIENGGKVDISIDGHSIDDLPFADLPNTYEAQENESKELQHAIDFRSFFVMDNMENCEKHAHEYAEVEATVPVMEGETFNYLNFPATYCFDCNVYYISRREYNRLKNKGKVLCQMLTAEEYERYRQGTKFDDLSPIGPLAMLGYTVKKDVLYDSERRQLLNWIIENEIMTKAKVIWYLESFIRRNQGQVKKASAVQKWREDRDYLRGIESIGKNAPPMGVARFINGKPNIHGGVCYE